MTFRYTNVFLFIFACFFILGSTLSHAQNQESSEDEVMPLGDILNPKTFDSGPTATAKDRANIYYKKCMLQRSLAFDKSEKEILCACTSAKMGDIITEKEFKHLYKDNRIGRDARGKIIAYAYTDCMGYVVENKIFNDCMVSSAADDIIHGKKLVCNCAANQYNKTINTEATYIMMEAIKHDPMTLNPLEHYFTTNIYGNMTEKYTGFCRSKMLYEKLN